MTALSHVSSVTGKSKEEIVEVLTSYLRYTLTEASIKGETATIYGSIVVNNKDLCLTNTSNIAQQFISTGCTDKELAAHIIHYLEGR